MKVNNRKTGNFGEQLALDYLLQHGFTILERNFQNKFGEIDIIAKEKDVTIFVEVKTKIGITYGMPEEMISTGKLARIRHMANIYLHGKEVACRIDVIAIVLHKDQTVERINHYKNVT